VESEDAERSADISLSGIEQFIDFAGAQLHPGKSGARMIDLMSLF
jgi:hypothetical protein